MLLFPLDLWTSYEQFGGWYFGLCPVSNRWETGQNNDLSLMLHVPPLGFWEYVLDFTSSHYETSNERKRQKRTHTHTHHTTPHHTTPTQLRRNTSHESDGFISSPKS